MIKKHILMNSKCRSLGSDEFSLWSERAKDKDLQSKIRVDFTADLENMTDEQAAKKLVDISNKGLKSDTDKPYRL